MVAVYHPGKAPADSRMDLIAWICCALASRIRMYFPLVSASARSVPSLSSKPKTRITASAAVWMADCLIGILFNGHPQPPESQESLFGCGAQLDRGFQISGVAHKTDFVYLDGRQGADFQPIPGGPLLPAWHNREPEAHRLEVAAFHQLADIITV